MSRPRESAKPRKRDGFWYFIRRVPLEFAHLDKRRKVVMSSGIRIADDPRGVRAAQAVEVLDAQLHQFWDDLREGRNPEAVKRFEGALETAGRFGFEYREATELKQQFGEVLKRIEALTALPKDQRADAFPALLGEVSAPKTGTLVADMFKVYQRIVAASLLKKSARQLHRWQTTRAFALTCFVKVVGKGKLIKELTHEDGYKFRDHWNKRVLAGEVQIDSANKQIGYVAAMFREVRNFERLAVEDIFQGKVIKGGEKRQRASFSIEHVQNVLLAPCAMDGLNDEAKGIFYVVAELGLRPSEVCGLLESHIHLEADVPFIEILDEGRELKTRNSMRTVPLVGVALDVMRLFPKGFERYRDKSDSLSAAVNKYLRNHDLLEHSKQAFYSLRHTFKDRLRRLQVEDELKDMLMGHSTGKERYGDGFVLERKLDVLQRMMFKAPHFSVGVEQLRPAFEYRRGRAGPALPREGGTARSGRREAPEVPQRLQERT